MTERRQLVVIGAGPAGMAAASLAARRGAATMIVDEQPAPGGQIYRAIESPGAPDRVLGEDYERGALLARDLRTSGAEYLAGTTVWRLSPAPSGPGLEVGLSVPGRAWVIQADQVIIATGAMERPMPIPGWTLPGVMTAGAAQTLLKTDGLAFENAVFAGTGPLLYIAAAQYVRAGAKPRAVLDTLGWGARFRAMKHLSQVADRWHDLRKGMAWVREIKRAGVPLIRGVTDLQARGDTQVRSVTYARGRGRKTIETARLLLHQGVVPNTSLAMAAGCDHRWDEDQLCWRPQITEWLESSVSGLRIAGDGGGIQGAIAAEHQGRLAGLSALTDLEVISEGERNTLCMSHLRAVLSEQKLRPFLDALFRPLDGLRIPADPDTVVCRCEEVTAGQVQECARLGCQGPNQLKSFCRAGMGPCQGRMCGLTVSEVMAAARGTSVNHIGHYRLRPPVKPVTLGDLAAIEDGPDDGEDCGASTG